MARLGKYFVLGYNRHYFIEDKMNRILMFAGAGISAESGLATFRETGGIWEQFDVNEVCNIRTFVAAKNDQAARAKIFQFYNLVKESILKAEPNAAHHQVARWQKKYGKERVIVMTANIDNLFEKAGCEDVIHIHGEIFHMHCHACGNRWHIGNKAYDPTERCPKCDSRLTKPHIVFFGEQAPLYETMAYHYHTKRMMREDLLLYVGSSMSVIPPTMLFPNIRAANMGKRVLVNKETNDFDNMFNYRYYGNASSELKLVDHDLVQPLMFPN
jgi:NAD-dependent deacetylase